MDALRRLPRPSALLLLFAALALRVAVPGNWMPVSDARGEITLALCSGASPLVVHLDEQVPQPPRDPCPFALATGGALLTPDLPVLPTAIAVIGALPPMALIAAKLAAARQLRPPARGPPLKP